jgi:hypothetical protein
MKIILFLVALSLLSSCVKEDIPESYNLYGTWWTPYENQEFIFETDGGFCIHVVGQDCYPYLWQWSGGSTGFGAGQFDSLNNYLPNTTRWYEILSYYQDSMEVRRYLYSNQTYLPPFKLYRQ